MLAVPLCIVPLSNPMKDLYQLNAASHKKHLCDMKCLLLLQIIRQLSSAWSEVKILQILIEEGVHALLNDAVVTCTMQSLTNPKQDHQEKQSDLSKAASKDCLSCRIWGGIVHLGIAGFVGSHVHQMPGRFSKAFVGLFSFGEKRVLFLAFKLLPKLC